MSAADATYPPLDVPKEVAENVWIVDSGPMRVAGLVPLPVRMTVVRLRDDGLLLHSPTRFAANLQHRLEELGPIRHLVAPNSAHWTFVKDWQQHVSQAMTWAAPGLRKRGQVKRSGVRLDRDLCPASAADWPGEVEQIEVPGAGGFCEVCLFHRASSTLILTDLVQNLEASKLPIGFRLFATLAGVTAPDGRAPIYLRATVRAKGDAARAAARRLAALKPERVIFTHGNWFKADATARLERSLRWLLG